MNRFDKGLGYYEPGMGGFLSKIGKKLEKAVKKVNNKVKDVIRRPIAKATVPSSVRKLGRKMDEKGINKVIGAVALSVFAPGIGAAVAGSMGAAGGALAAGAVKGAVGMAIGKAATATAKSGMTDYSTVKATEQAMRDEAKVAEEIAAAIRTLPEFQGVVDGLRAEGYTDAEIAAHWAESSTYYTSAVAAAANTVYPAVLQEAQSEGIPNAPEVAAQTSVMMAEQGVKQVQNQVTGKSALLPLLAIGAALFLGG